MPKLCESEIEKMVIDELIDLGYDYVAGPDIAPDTPGAERAGYSDILLINRVRSALARLNPSITSEVIGTH